MYNTETSQFSIRKALNWQPYTVRNDPTTGRLIAAGIKSSKGYITKFYPASFELHSSFISSVFQMNVITTGTYDVIPEYGVSISLVTSINELSDTKTNVNTYQYSGSIPTVSDVYYQVADLSLPIIENYYYEVTPDLP